MAILRKIFAATAPLALIAVSACTQPFEAKVSRFQAMPVPEGQTYVIEATDPRNRGGLEFAQYASLVSQRLAAYGYRPADGGKAELIVKFDYGVDKGQPKVVSRPSLSAGFGPWGGPWGYGPYGRRWGYRSAFFYGWDPYGYDPFFGQEIDQYDGPLVEQADLRHDRAAHRHQNRPHAHRSKRQPFKVHDSSPNGLARCEFISAGERAGVNSLPGIHSRMA